MPYIIKCEFDGTLFENSFRFPTVYLKTIKKAVKDINTLVSLSLISRLPRANNRIYKTLTKSPVYQIPGFISYYIMSGARNVLVLF